MLFIIFALKHTYDDSNSLKNCVNQSPGDIMACKAHDTFLRGAKAEEIDTAIPYDLTIDDCEFLMEASLVLDFNPVRFQLLRVFYYTFLVFLWEVLSRAGNDHNFCII